MKVFLSSTAEDLTEYRKVADDTILGLAQESLIMERFGPRPETPIEECERLARECDLLICIVAHRYGSIPENTGSSFTQREVETAYKAGKKILAWIIDDSYPWTNTTEQDLFLDPTVLGNSSREAEIKERINKLVDFKNWLRNTVIVESFTTADNLGRKVAVALNKYIPKRTAVEAIPDHKISIARLPTTSSNLFGRETELAILDDAWTNPNTNIVSFVAWGGVGKTALVNHWLKQRMASDNYRGAERVYGWSFFSQGTSERAASADLFIDQGLRWFGDADPTAGSPWDKGERLAAYIRQSRTLLILDGLEPLQHPPGFQEGRLKDAGMQALLVELAAHQPGLCVISTRERVGDLVEFESSTVTQHSLEHLSPQAGAQLLSSLNVNGDEEELEQSARELDGHAFSLTLLGSYLDEVLGGDIRRRNEIKNLFDDTRYGSAAQKMIAAYEEWLGEGIELAILRLLGFFDSPADLTSLIALRERPSISGLTEPLQHFKGREWNQAISQLRRIKLLAEVTIEDPGTLDTHPLVRYYFKQQLKKDHPTAWRLGNGRLYEHLKKATKEFPNTVEEMAPLFQAIAHGCAAGRYKEVLRDVFLLRIQRGNNPFSMKRLGAVGANLAALASFFEEPWHKLGRGLSDHETGFLLGAVGFCLVKTGRLKEAVEPMQSALEIFISKEDHENAARAANNVSELYLTMGEFAAALEHAQLGVKLADEHEHRFERIVLRTTLGSVLYQTGRPEDSAIAFEEAEKLQKKLLPNLKFLYAAQGFDYREFLLSLGKVQDVKERAAYSLEITEKLGDLLSIGLDNLSLGCAWLVEAKMSNTHDFSPAASFLQDAVEMLRRAGDITYLTRGLLWRAALYRIKGDLEHARKHLLEVRRNVSRTGMISYEVDYHLESALLFVAEDENDRARVHLAHAKILINRLSYHRRGIEVAELETQLG